jgi:hypothetical protein
MCGGAQWLRSASSQQTRGTEIDKWIKFRSVSSREKSANIMFVNEQKLSGWKQTFAGTSDQSMAYWIAWRDSLFQEMQNEKQFQTARMADCCFAICFSGRMRWRRRGCGYRLGPGRGSLLGSGLCESW